MSEMVCCPLTNDGDDCFADGTYSKSVVKAAKDWRCCECHEPIVKGTKHSVERGVFDALWMTYRTCLSCLEIRTHFSCGEGWTYEMLWEQLEENFFENMVAGGPCMKGLSPAAKARLFERRLKWLEDKNG